MAHTPYSRRAVEPDKGGTGRDHNDSAAAPSPHRWQCCPHQMEGPEIVDLHSSAKVGEGWIVETAWENNASTGDHQCRRAECFDRCPHGALNRNPVDDVDGMGDDVLTIPTTRGFEHVPCRCKPIGMPGEDGQIPARGGQLPPKCQADTARSSTDHSVRGGHQRSALFRRSSSWTTSGMVARNCASVWLMVMKKSKRAPLWGMAGCMIGWT
jgi:hypothetical protein